MKFHIPVKFLFALLFTALFSCTVNDIQDLKSEKNAMEEVTVTNSDKIQESILDSNGPEEVLGTAIPHILDKMFEKTGKTASMASKGILKHKTAMIDLGHALKIKSQDEDGGSTYTFDMFLDSPDATTFYNVVIGETGSGLAKEPVVIEYTMTKKAIDEFMASGMAFNHFRATMRQLPFDDFFSGNELDGKNSCYDEGSIGGTGDSGTTTGAGGTFNASYGTTSTSNTFGYRDNIVNYTFDVSITEPTSGYQSQQSTQTHYTPSQLDAIFGNAQVPQSTVTFPATMATIVAVTVYYDAGATCPIRIHVMDIDGIFSTFDSCADQKTQKGSLSAITSGCVVYYKGYAVSVNQAALEIDAMTNHLLSDNQLGFLSQVSSRAFTKQTYNFLTADNSASNIAFVLAAIDAKEDGAEVDYEDRVIIDPTVPQCVEDIILKLINDNAYVDLGDMPDFIKRELNLSGYIMDVFNNNSGYHINFNVANLPPNSSGQLRNASTDPRRDSSNNIIYFDITLDKSYLKNATDLAIARTIIHESLHAYISYIYQTQMFSDLSSSLRHLLSQQGATPDSAQHKLMAQDFVNALANSLENWDNSSIADKDYYEALCWSGGMLSTTTFNSLDKNFRTKCINANIAEGNAGSNGMYNVNTAKGAKNCN